MAQNGKNAKEEGRNGRVWQLYAVRGWTQEQVAEELGISQARVSQIVSAVRKEIPLQTREEIVQERVEQIRAVVRAVVDAALEYGDKDAVSSLVKLWEREAKLLGLDAPTKQEIKGRLARYDISGVNLDDLA
jgi:predicted transcriptional regulator